MEAKHAGLKKIIVIVLLIVGCFFALKWHMETHQNHITTTYYQTKISKLKQQDKSYNKQSVIHKLKQQDPNLPVVERNARNRINHGMGLAYNHCQNNSNFYKNKGKISQLLGINLGNQVISNVRPYSGNISSTPISLAQHENGIQIGFGKYNPANQSIELNVIVHFMSTKNANTKLNRDATHHKSYQYYTSYQINYYPNDSKDPFIVEHYDCNLNSNEPYPQNQ